MSQRTGHFKISGSRKQRSPPKIPTDDLQNPNQTKNGIWGITLQQLIKATNPQAGKNTKRCRRSQGQRHIEAFYHYFSFFGARHRTKAPTAAKWAAYNALASL